MSELKMPWYVFFYFFSLYFIYLTHPLHESLILVQNEINSAKRLKYAVAEKSEGEKILLVKAAEAEAEAKYLSGVGVAKQRKAIVDGLRTSIVDFSEGVGGTTAKDVMDLLLLTQYYDCIQQVGSAPHCKTTFVPTSKGVTDQMRQSLMQADMAKIV